MPTCQNGGRRAQAYQGTNVGERRAVACPDHDAGVQTVCFKLNLAEECPGIDAVGSAGQMRVQVPMQGRRRVEAVPGDDVGV